MTATLAMTGLGAKFKRGDGGSPETFVEIPEVKEITFPSFSKEFPEATHLNSDNGYREYIPGLKDGGEASLKCNYLPNSANQNLLRSDFLTQTTARNYQILIPGSPNITCTFLGIVQNWQPNLGGGGDVATLDVTIKVSSAPTFA